MQRLDPKKLARGVKALRKGLEERVIGQPEAIDEIVLAYQSFEAGLHDKTKPIASFLFLGPTGVGKTKIVEAIAETLAGDVRAMIKIDCAEFQHSHEVAKLIGSPPGYLGHRETHPILSQEVLDQFHTEKMKISFVLFDEIEKASDALYNLLLGIMDKATLTLGDNRRVDFSRAMIFMTSNLGAREMDSVLHPNLGFVTERPPEGEKLHIKTGNAALLAARKKFRPEFVNRLDHVIAFHPLDDAALRAILDLEIKKVSLMLPTGVTLALSKSSRDELIREGTDPRYGARPLGRTINKRIIQPLASLISTKQIDTMVLIKFEDGEWEYYGLDLGEMAAA